MGFNYLGVDCLNIVIVFGGLFNINLKGGCMKQSLYVTNNLGDSIVFIQVNTDWIRSSKVSFKNKDEIITLVSSVERTRGIKPFKIYIDYSFDSVMRINKRHEFVQRFLALGLTPVLIKELR